MAWNLLGRSSTGVLRVDELTATDQGWSPGTRLYLIRQGQMVSLTVMDLMRAEVGTGYRRVMTLPAGFAPALDQYFTTWRGGRARVLANGTVELSAPGTALDYFTQTYQVTSPMPKGGV